MDAALVARSRDAKAISLIGLAHFFSHYFQLSLPALFPLIHAETGIGYTRLGLLSTVFFVTSGLAQTPSGFIVDRIGARPSLIAGLALLAGSIALYGVSISYPFMVALAVLGGLGNSIFHPADYAILTGTVSERRIGRAYSVHGLGGFIGYGVAPVAMFALGTWLGWQQALFAAGLAGLAVAFAVHLQRRDLVAGAPPPDATARAGAAAPGRRTALADGIRLLAKAPVVLNFLFFALIAMGQVGMMTMGPSAMIAMMTTPLAIANGSITALLAGVVAGVVIGGFVADRCRRHDRVVAAVVAVAALLFLLVPLFEPARGALLAVFAAAGVFYGISGPTRDMVVRSIAPADARGKVFGFIYSGLDFGSAAAALVFGALIEAGEPRWVFFSVTLVMLGSVVCILASQMLARRAGGPLAGDGGAGGSDA